MKDKCEVCDLQAELDATNRQVEILSDALAESRREVAALKAVQGPAATLAVRWHEPVGKVAYVLEVNLPLGVHKLYTIPPVPDAFGTREGEHPQYIQGWNDCRAEMLRGKTK